MLKTAIILAGGLGTRLRSVVQDVPKPMAPIRGRPFLAFQLDYWIAQGIEKFIISVGYKHQTIMDYFADVYHDAKIEYVIEPSCLGTGGGLLLAIKQTHLCSPCLLLNGDTYFNVDLEQFIFFSEINQADWTFALFYTEDPGRYMGIELGHEGRICSLKTEIKPPKGRLANGGVYWFNPTSLANVCFDSDRPLSLEDDIFPVLLKADCRLFGYESAGLFIDIGLPDDYQRAGGVL